MLPLKYVRKDTSSPSGRTLRIRALTSDPGISDPASTARAELQWHVIQSPSGTAQGEVRRSRGELHTGSCFRMRTDV